MTITLVLFESTRFLVRSSNFQHLPECRITGFKAVSLVLLARLTRLMKRRGWDVASKKSKHYWRLCAELRCADGAGTPSHTLRPSRITQKTAEPSHLNVVNCRPVHVFLKPPSRHGRSRIHVEVNWLDRQVKMSEILSCQRSPLGLIEKDI